MNVHYLEIGLETRRREELVNVTSRLQEAVSGSGAISGLLVAMSLHTTAGMTINENADPDVEADVLRHLAKLAPAQGTYDHAEGNSDAHIKCSLVGPSVVIPIREGKLVLGTWQGIYFCEFDGPRRRRLCVQIMA